MSRAIEQELAQVFRREVEKLLRAKKYRSDLAPADADLLVKALNVAMAHDTKDAAVSAVYEMFDEV